jgi:CDGSH-type Zn-finger protein
VPTDERRVRPVPGGPILVEGPVEIVLEDGSVATSDRFMVALCACRRSGSYPFCDTSHRRKDVSGGSARQQPSK